MAYRGPFDQLLNRAEGCPLALVVIGLLTGHGRVGRGVRQANRQPALENKEERKRCAPALAGAHHHVV